MNLTERYQDLKSTHPRIRIRDAAEKLAVSELELVLVQPGTVRLRSDAKALMEALPSIGRAMALTRNAWCVHERKGAWTACEISGPPHFPVGVVHNADIDLRLFLGRWKHMVYAQVPSRGRVLHAVQVFDQAGDALHKIYATDATDMDAFQALVAELTDADPAPLALEAVPAANADRPDDQVDAQALLDDWAAMTDTHQFFGMIRRHEVGRLQALRLAEHRFARRLDGAHAVRAMLNGASESGQAIMCFVGSAGVIQIHTGPVERIVEMDTWLNVMDPDFNLHLDTRGIASAWHVTKPTEDGPVNSLEVYDAEGGLIVQFFGARKPGQAEDVAWTELVAGLA